MTTSDRAAPALGELARLARVLIEARHEQCAALASADTIAADLDRAARCTVQATANFTEFVMSEWVLVALSSGGGAMERARDAWREYAFHAAGCVECGETSWENCDDTTRRPGGRTLREAAIAVDTLTPERPADAGQHEQKHGG